MRWACNNTLLWLTSKPPSFLLARQAATSERLMKISLHKQQQQQQRMIIIIITNNNSSQVWLKAAYDNNKCISNESKFT